MSKFIKFQVGQRWVSKSAGSREVVVEITPDVLARLNKSVSSHHLGQGFVDSWSKERFYGTVHFDPAYVDVIFKLDESSSIKLILERYD